MTMKPIPEAPPLTAVKNWTAWVVAFSPLTGSVAAGFVLGFLWGNVARWSDIQVLASYALWLGFMLLLTHQDWGSLKSQGFDPKAMGIRSWINLPMYLFSRAKAFGHSKAYAITWWVMAVIAMLILFI